MHTTHRVKIWPLSPFENLAFFEAAYGQIWPFNFFGLGNPDNTVFFDAFF
jgi:hypothetical protein